MSIAYIVAWAVAAVLVGVGLFALASPAALARRYGIAVHGHDAAGWVRATGIRDVALGVVLAAAAYTHARALTIVVAAMGIVISIADLGIVMRHGGSEKHRGAHAGHAAGIVAFVLVLAMALFAVGM
ncbi:MAG: DUF4267 domain-containing protein [Candidatus Eremiobacteraeota bacterium]|nr:DUF4267 domain-containing protein [Candidatus Eremiobacteraeota bacterium]